MNRSNCCGAKVYDDTDICSECFEHCDVWVDKEPSPFKRALRSPLAEDVWEDKEDE